eukprot:TRINITY_DN12330_c0_g1_i2.p1 TRINITY_DN12330_c0_g1~~TRINITY_DN12330_c0_g1_i2.p1  ORF type:complete len:194 (-),score=38.59 TRINITY_DN12330_c0_g1_i2:58-639(-)
MGWLASLIVPSCCLTIPGNAAALTSCAIGEKVDAYFGGEVDLGDGFGEPCNPTVKECWFAAEVHATHTRRTSTGEACGDGSGTVRPSEELESLPCTLLLHLHWEASDEAWRTTASQRLEEELMPDEVIGDFDWHLIFRYRDVGVCEQAHATLQSLLRTCPDEDRCYVHPYVKAVELIGHEPREGHKLGDHGEL